MPLYLLVTERSGNKRTVAMNPVDAVSVGRDTSCGISLPDSKVSRKHCTIVADDLGLRVIDHNSRNGTLVNEIPVKESCAVKVGDVIQAGDSRIALVTELKQEASEGQPAPPPSHARAGGWGKRLVYRITCPNCWHAFFPHKVSFVAKHPELIGDPVLGSNEFLRFQPKRFTPAGEAVDPKGIPTSELACPLCHLPIVEILLEVAPLFISLVGSPASGKSYFLATMTWELRRMMPRAFLSFTDADPAVNACITDYERTLFMNPRPESPTQIIKTDQTDSRLHRRYQIKGVDVRVPVPFQFLLQPTPQHPGYTRAAQASRIVVLYDNAGEDFRPGAETAESAAIQHLAASHVLLVLYDLAQDPRFRGASTSNDPQLTRGLRPEFGPQGALDRQETILREASVLLRRHLGLAHDKRISRPLIVIVPKFDIWQEMAGLRIDTEPYTQQGDSGPLLVDTARVEEASDSLRKVLLRYSPEFVATAENLSAAVRYIPVSSLGCSPTFVRKGNYYGISPKDIHPRWVTVPLLYSLCKWAPGMISSVPKAGQKGDRG